MIDREVIFGNPEIANAQISPNGQYIAFLKPWKDTRNPKASDILYVSALAAPNTINTIPERTLLAFGDHGKVTGTLPKDGGNCEAVLDDFRKAGIDLEQLAADSQWLDAKTFDESWQNLLRTIESKGRELQAVS